MWINVSGSARSISRVLPVIIMIIILDVTHSVIHHFIQSFHKRFLYKSQSLPVISSSSINGPGKEKNHRIYHR